MEIFNYKPYFKFRNFLLSILFIAFLPIITKAQTPLVNQNEIPFSNLDELRITVYANTNFEFDLNVKISPSQKVYANIQELFDNLKISYLLTENDNKLTGFINNEKNSYSIHAKKSEINFANRIFKIDKSLNVVNGVFYIEIDALKDSFGIDINFLPRSLSATLSTNFELPYVREKRIEKTRDNLAQLTNSSKDVDSIVKRNYHIFKFGTLDWAINSFQTENQSATNNVRLGLGAEFLYGEANIAFNYNDKFKFDNRQLQYNWRWVDNDKKYVKQVQLGKFYNRSISFLSAPINGITFSNASTTVRKASGFYTINETTEPNWTVELYLNEVLVNFTTADASGSYSFKVPILYGSTTIKLKFYGPLGEERFEERLVNNPYVFLPSKSFEYTVSSGILQDNENSRFTQANFNYGLNRFATLGGGIEYLSSIVDKPLIPFANASFQPFSRLILNFEYAHDVRTRSLLNFYFTKNAFLEVELNKYVKGQLATRFNALEERKFKLFYPFKLKTVGGFMKLNYSQLMYEVFDYKQMDYTLSAFYKKLSINSATVINWVSANDSYASTFLSLSYMTKKNLVIRPSMGYSINENDFINYRMEIEKRYNKMYFAASYQKNVVSKSDNYLLSFKYDLPYTRLSAAAFYTGNVLSFSQEAQGSMAFGGDHYTDFNSNYSVGRGGILFYPFLDLNENGIMDNGERMVPLSNVKISGGQAKISKKDHIVRISGLNAFVNYDAEFDSSDLENIAWRFKHNKYRVLIDPNQYKRIYVPVISVGEVNGTVYLNGNASPSGLARMIIEIFDSTGNKVAETLSEEDGYYSYLGLSSGKHSIKINEEQLKKLNFKCSSGSKTVLISINENGDLIENIDFTLIPIQPIVTNVNTNEEFSNEFKSAVIFKAETESHFNTSFGKIFDNKELFFSVQIGAFKNYVPSKRLLDFMPVYYEFTDDGLIRYISGKFETYSEAKKMKYKINKLGVKDAYIVKYRYGIRYYSNKN